MQATRMKLNIEQCSNLPFPIGCRVWYDVKLDTRDYDAAVSDTSRAVNHGAVMERKWGALLGGTAAVEKCNHDTFSFRRGIVTAAFLDMMASNILYEITPIKDVDDVTVKASPETRLYPDNELLYGPGSRVYIMASNTSEDSKEPMVSGQVLLCRLKSRQLVPQEHCLDTTETKNTVLRIKAALAQENARILRLHKPQNDSQHVATITQSLKTLLTVDIDNELLTTTKIGASVSKLKSYSNQEVAKLANSLLSKWHSINDSTEQCAQIMATKQRLEAEEGDGILDALCSLNNVAINTDILRSTGIGKVVAQFKKSKNKTEAMLAKELVNKWKEIASTEKKSASIKSPQPTVSSQTTAPNQVKKYEPPVFLYTVKVARGDGSFHIEDGIAKERVKYCRDDSVVERATSGQTNKTEIETKPEFKPTAQSEGVPTWLASPSTLTISETTMEMHSHDNDSQQNGHKRKSDNQDVSSANMKRSCSKDAFGHALSVKSVDTANPAVTLKQFLPHSNVSRNSNGKENIKVQIRQEAVRYVVGTNGQTIEDIQKRTGCKIFIPPKRYNGSNEPLCATITGESSSAIEKASEMINSIIDKATNCTSPSGNYYCKVNIPPWLVYDDVSKARLHHYLNNSERNMKRIGTNTNCFLEISEWTKRGISLPFYDPSYIFIKANTCLDATQTNNNLRHAKEDIEDTLLEYIHKDSSQGRLFYDTAISCNQLHGHIDRRSTTVHQRNPFSINNQYVYINVVELPYSQDPVTKTKEFHGHFITNKQEGILRAVNRKTGCTLKICGDNFNVPLKYCDPYIFLYGDNRIRVDEAYLILTDAIKDRLNSHKHWTWNEHSEQREHALEFYKRNHFQ